MVANYDQQFLQQQTTVDNDQQRLNDANEETIQLLMQDMSNKLEMD